MLNRNIVDTVAEWLHDEDNTGRAIHEDMWAMQVPSFPWNKCNVCCSLAEKLIQHLIDKGLAINVE